jgi:hypothetical protein
MNHKCLNRDGCNFILCEGKNRHFIDDLACYDKNEDFEDHDLYYGKLRTVQSEIKKLLAVHGVEMELRTDEMVHLVIRHDKNGKHGHYDITL